MIAGQVVGLPRGGLCVCGGCRRVLPVAASVALDLAGERKDTGKHVFCW